MIKAKSFFINFLIIAAGVLCIILAENAVPEKKMQVNADTEGYYTFLVSNGNAKIIEVDTRIIGNVTVPSVLGGYPVTSIAPYAFEGCSELTGVVIPEGVTGIAKYAFYECSGLKTIVIPNSVTNIGMSAFYGCSSVEKLTVPFVGDTLNGTSNTHLGYIFGSSSDTYQSEYVPETLKEVIVTSARSIGASAFNDCSEIVSVKISNSVTSIAWYAFDGCSSLKSIEIPNSVKSIGDYAFRFCSGLTDIDIPESVTSIGKSVFNGCNNLQRITVSASSTAYMDVDGVLYSKDKTILICCPCNKKGSFVIPDSVTNISESAFYGCNELTSIEIPNSITNIGLYAFYECSGLKTIEIPNSVTEIGVYALYGCSSLEKITIPFIGGSSAGTGTRRFGHIFGSSSYSSQWEYVPETLKEVVLTCETKISEKAFYGCSGIKSIEIPESVTFISSDAFGKCKGLKKLTIPFVDGTTDVFGAANENLKELIITGGTNIVEGVFKKCTGLESLTLPVLNVSLGSLFRTEIYGSDSSYVPETLKKVVIAGGSYVADYAFADCSNLEIVEMPSGLKSIGRYAFDGCRSLVSVAIPKSLVEIGDYAFWGCKSLESIEIPCVSIIGVSAFNSCSSLEKITIPFVGSTPSGNDKTHFGYLFGATDYSENSDHVPKSLKEVVITGGTSIAENAFYGCTNLVSITIPDSIKSIHDYAFRNCKRLENFNVSDSNTAYIDIDGVLYNKSVTKLIDYPSGKKGDLVVPDGVTNVCSYAFRNSSGLVSVKFPYGIKNIDSYMFIGCSSLVSVELPDSVISIQSYAFEGCSSLKYVEIPGSVTTLGDKVFSGCKNLERIDVSISNTSYTDIDGVLFNKSGTTLICYPKSRKGNVVIPNGTTSINYEAFCDCSGITSVEIPSSVTQIGFAAFRGCTGLVNIELPNGISYIQSHLFYGCSNLASVKIPDNIIGIGEYVFYGCNSLLDIDIPDSVKSIGNDAFEGCSSLTNIEIPNSVTNIGNYTFYGCSSLKYIEIPDNVTKIGLSAFYGCSQLTEINVSDLNTAYIGIDGVLYNKEITTLICCPGGKKGKVIIPDTVTVIDSYGFRGCDGLTGIEIPNSVTDIEPFAFRNCSGLTNLKIPDSVTTIGYGIINGCSSLEKITIPFVGGKSAYGTNNNHFGSIFGAFSYSDNFEYVPTTLKEVVITGGTSIHSSAFKDCSSILNVEIPDSVTYIGSDAFEGCDSLEKIIIPFVGNEKDGTEYTNFGYIFGASKSSENSKYVPETLKKVVITGGTSIASSAFSGCSGITSVEIPDSVTIIGDSAFHNCSGLTSVKIGNGVTSIGRFAFEGCKKLEKLDISDSNEMYMDVDGVVYNKDKTTLICYLSAQTEFTIPDGVTAIADYAFYRCDGIKDIKIPNTVTSIGNYAFYGCSGLVGVVEIPNCVKTIGNFAFYNCSRIESVVIPASVTSIGDYAFNGCSGLTGVMITNGVTQIGNYAFYGCSNILDIEIPESVTSIGSYVFYGCSGITSIEIPESVMSIGAYAFYGCRGITSIEIPESVTGIGAYAFYGCGGITSIEIPKSVTSIGSGAFFGCDALEKITIPFVGNKLNGTSGTNFGYIFGTSDYRDNSDYVPAMLKEVIVTGGTTIGSNAFHGCSNIENILLPKSITSIGSNAFYCCRSIKTFEVPSNVTSIGLSAFEGCDNLEKITIPFVGNKLDGTSDTHLGYIFGASSYSYNAIYAYSLKEVVITGGKSIGENAFYKCNRLLSVRLANSVTEIGESAFMACINLASIEIPDSVKKIGADAFCSCKGLVSVKIPSATTCIDDSVFYGCSALENVEISNNVTSIGPYAFAYCSKLKSVEIPDSVTSIGDGAFMSCSLLEKINVSASNLSYKDIEGVLYSADQKILLCYPCGKKGSLVIPEGVTSIAAYAARGSGDLVSVEIPGSVKDIGKYAFYSCVALEEINVSDSNTVYADIDGALCSKDKTTLICCSGSKKSEFIVPDSVTTINESAFYNCKNLEKLTIPFVGNTLNGTDKTHFGYIFGALEVAYNPDYVPTTLKQVIITGGTSIDEYAFYKCENLVSVEIPDCVTHIGVAAFSKCSSLVNVRISNGVNIIEDDTFYYCSSLKYIEIPSSVTNIKQYAFAGCSSLTSVVIPYGVKTIGASAFSGCSGLTSVEIPKSVTGIGSYAFPSNNDFAIYGTCGSYAEKYAFSNGYRFRELPIPAESLKLIDGVNSIVMDIGATRDVVFDIYPEDTTDSITLTANNSNVVIEGLNIYATGIGETVITATATSGVSCEFTVNIVMPDVAPGDVDNDGIVTVADALNAINVILHYSEANALHKITADVDENGRVDILDIMYLLNMI